ncbi:MYG1 protein [Histoplasma ohiense]|nr:MYG1 protein [Histoplasma ohiense (nom. inval.)]
MLRLHSLLRMAEDTAAKRLKTSPPTIGTHNGHFHADEALAVYLLRLLPTYTSSPLVRTRDPSLLATCHTVVDVGGEYDPSRNRYDHHQRTFTATFPQHSTKLSSAGLIYLHFGKAIIAQHTSLPPDHPDVTTLYEKLYSDFIEALDANDNGISVYDNAALNAAGVRKRFRDSGISLGALVGDLNHPDPTATGPQDEDALFENASKFIGDAFLRKLRVASASWLPARATVSEAYKARFDTHASGRILVLPKAGIPWKEHLFVLEEEEAAAGVEAEAGKIGGAHADRRQVYYVLYPESTSPEAKWRVQCVPVTDTSFESRRPLPEAWCGIRDGDLDKLLASEETSVVVPPGAVFVHATGFIGGHATREGAFAMAVRSLG